MFDPFGDPIDLTTGRIGTLTADAVTFGNTTVALTCYGWEGSQLKQDQTIRCDWRSEWRVCHRFSEEGPGGRRTG